MQSTQDRTAQNASRGLGGPVISARLYSTLSECACHYTTRRRNAHGIAEYELLYPWHPWAGCLVHIHEAVEKRAERASVAASLVGHPGDGWRSRPGCSIGRLAARWDLVESPSRFRFLIEHDLFGKP